MQVGVVLDIFSLATVSLFFLILSGMDRWMTWDFTSFSTEFKLYLRDCRVMDDCVQWNHFTSEKIPASNGAQIRDC